MAMARFKNSDERSRTMLALFIQKWVLHPAHNRKEYLNKDLVHSRIADLEAYCNESIWVKLIVNSDIYLIGTFYSPKTADKDFFRNFNLNIEAAFNISKKCNYT